LCNCDECKTPTSSLVQEIVKFIAFIDESVKFFAFIDESEE